MVEKRGNSRMIRVNNKFVEALEDIKKRHKLKFKTTNATETIADILKQNEISFVEDFRVRGKKKKLWF